LLKVGFFGNICIVRTDKNTYINIIAKVKVGHFFGHKQIAFTGNRHGIGIAFALQLDHIRRGDAGFFSSVMPLTVLRYCNEVKPSPCTTALICFEFESSVLRTIKPTLRCSSTPLPIKAALVRRYEIAFHAFPHKMKIIVRGPDILARTAKLYTAVVLASYTGATGMFDRTHIRLTIKYPDGLGLCFLVKKHNAVYAK
jgi:hypothetical protein